jgi:hypothetical protein
MKASTCQIDVKNWAWAMFKGIRDMGYDMVISANDMVHLIVPRICQLLDGQVGAVGKILLIVLGCVLVPRLVCVHLKPGVLALIPVVGNLM